MKLLSSLLLVHGALSSNLYGSTGLREQQATHIQRVLEMEAIDAMQMYVGKAILCYSPYSHLLHCCLISYRLMEFERYLEFSMSVSMSYSTGPGSEGSGSGGSGSGSGGGNNGSPSSSSPPAPTLSSATTSPIASPSTSLPPPPTSSPDIEAPDTEAPSSILADNITLDRLFECSDQGVVAASAPGAVTTPMSLAVMYEAESTANLTDAFLDDLELALFSMSLTAALDCNATQRRGLQPVDMRRQLTTSTTEMGTYSVV